MKVVLDTDVVLDVLIKRAPFAADSAELFSRIESGAIVGMVSAHTVTTLYYMAAKHVGDQAARVMLRDVLGILQVASVDQHCLQAALDFDFRDYEDAVVYESARQAGADTIVTRNLRACVRSPNTSRDREGVVRKKPLAYARGSSRTMLLTHALSDYRNAALPVYSPTDLLKLLDNH